MSAIVSPPRRGLAQSFTAAIGERSKTRVQSGRDGTRGRAGDVAVVFGELRARGGQGILFKWIAGLDPACQFFRERGVSGTERRSDHPWQLACIVGRPANAWELFEVGEQLAGFTWSFGHERCCRNREAEDIDVDLPNSSGGRDKRLDLVSRAARPFRKADSQMACLHLTRVLGTSRPL